MNKSSSAVTFLRTGSHTRLVLIGTIWLASRISVDKLQDLPGIQQKASGGQINSEPAELTSGRRVTIPVPRGKKSLPTMF
jgi:hypothetical protein